MHHTPEVSTDWSLVRQPRNPCERGISAFGAIMHAMVLGDRIVDHVDAALDGLVAPFEGESEEAWRIQPLRRFMGCVSSKDAASSTPRAWRLRRRNSPGVIGPLIGSTNGASPFSHIS